MKETTKVLARPENYGTADPDLAIGAAIIVVASAQTKGGWERWFSKLEVVAAYVAT